MDHRSRCQSYRPRQPVSPDWQQQQQRSRRNRAHTVCLIVDDTHSDAIRFRRSRSNSSSDQSLGEVQLDVFGSQDQDSVFDLHSSMGSSNSSAYMSGARRASSPPFISVVQLSTRLSPSAHIAARFSPSHPAGRLCYRPLQLPSLPRYSELSSTYVDVDTMSALDPRVALRVTPPPPYHASADPSGTFPFRGETDSHRHLSRTLMIAFLFAASLQTLTGAITACLALASLGFMPEATVTEPTFFSSGFTVLIAGIHGMIGFFSLKKKPRMLKLCLQTHSSHLPVSFSVSSAQWRPSKQPTTSHTPTNASKRQQRQPLNPASAFHPTVQILL
ncbi:uncharacterized protein LOC134181047 isoform X2 [Corticium candelabrum]|uniref:uncharacterized protein LOC134181047 isoform X2 n=1 Tax=Corticium candelabrum TaxID=121492 RepID=UPI002E25F513|nr:uncharacterized protein LOC134181047 isoform X2 [Corticium candelabrum]